MKKIKWIPYATCSLSILLIVSACSKNPAPQSSSGASASGEIAHAEDHDHGEGSDHTHTQETPGPNGGRLIQSVEPHAEFLLRPDRTAQISFFDEQLKPVAPSDQVVSLTGGDRSSPFQLTFQRSDKVLVSTDPIPAGDDLPLVLHIKSGKHPEGVYEKFYLNLGSCPTCKYQEYACICGHSEGDEH